ncbi:MAG TPA: biotin--[acetyl-CoA-carboxylase] ligase [Rhodanobacteraceae bacterium]|nr:biotin--[acetyl-CoA-carboxylase] ligase [Rhodanobacteraceae bacterium]
MARSAAPAGAPLLYLLASGNLLSGPALAQRLGISRAAVWKQVDALRRAGLEIVSDARGYRLARRLDLLDVAQIRAGLPAALARGVGSIENHWRLDSTSSELARHVADLPDLSFVFADWQRAGRGRRGRQWLSPPASNLQFSCLKRFAGSFAALSGLSLAAGIAAAGALEDCGIGGVALKWPNDLVYHDAKLGGILVELGGEFMGPCHAIIGIGINVHLPEAVRLTLDRPCTDLTELCRGETPSRNQLAAALIARLMVQLEAFDRSGFAGCAQAWAQRDALAGRNVRVEAARGYFEGIADGVDARGALQVQTAAGPRSIDSGDVTVRPT